MEKKHKYSKLTWVVLSHVGEMSNIDYLVKSLVTPILHGKNIHLLYSLDEVHYSNINKKWEVVNPMEHQISYSKAQYKVRLHLEEIQQMNCSIRVTVWGTPYDYGL